MIGNYSSGPNKQKNYYICPCFYNWCLIKVIDYQAEINADPIIDAFNGFSRQDCFNSFKASL